MPQVPASILASRLHVCCSPSDITPVELIDASLGPLSELAARTGLSLQDAATLVAARAATVHSTAGGAADGMATRGLGDLIGAVPDAVSDVIDWGRWQLSYYKCIAKCIVGYKPVSKPCCGLWAVHVHGYGSLSGRHAAAAATAAAVRALQAVVV